MARILIISQVFFPDTSAVSQVLSDLAEDLKLKGHEVDVFSSRQDYENPQVSFAKNDSYHGVNIKRLRQTSFNKESRVGRIINFASFNGNMLLRLLLIRKCRYRQRIYLRQS